ncbi:MAG: hypothetical protein NZM35_03495 [Chitinophagales bacterium]|nr:hypothetical protein [Chitinophagales bacterium]MDW8419266.1 hypothetical protein [Chitinophagales bacterium]
MMRLIVTKRVSLLLCLCASGMWYYTTVYASESISRKFEPNATLIISPAYAARFPLVHLADRFGFGNQVSLGVFYKFQNNWLIGAEGGFLFGSRVHEGYVTDYISTSQGQFISQDNRLLNVRPQLRGFDFFFRFGRVFPLNEKFPDAGLLVVAGAGFLQHKIALDARENLLPQLSKIYRKGYDRLCNGPALSLLTGGLFLDRKKLYSFYGGVQLDAAYTQNRRPFDFYEQRKLNEKRIDMSIGFRLGWVLPIYQHASEKEYFYY